MAIDTSTNYDKRFDKVDSQFQEMRDQFKTVNDQFKNVNDQFKTVNDQFKNVNDQLDKITTALVKGFDSFDKRLETKADKADMQRIFDLLDKVIKQQEIDNDERLIMGHQLDRLDRWVHEVAKKIGYELVA